LGVDINPKVVEMTNQGKLHIIEPGMEEMLQDVVKAGKLKADVKPDVCDAYFMVVPTPLKVIMNQISLTLRQLRVLSSLI
jgi:UDP-N-acetyl-D-mannosaminuronic acid dehydrogenase